MLKLIKNYNYDNNYDYIKTFTSKDLQNEFFNTLSFIEIEEHEYIKEHESFKIKISYDELVSEGVNYITFNNGYKDIYAFIISKEYVNSQVTRINYEIDVIQTFMFDFSIKNSFINRKVCNINEISDFDEGIDIGEHIIEFNEIAINKDTNWFAMFNGIKEQILVFNDSGNITDSINIPFYTSKPLTLIDDVQYPLYFMPLQETYIDPSINTGGSGGSSNTPIPSNDLVASARKLIGVEYVFGGNYPPLGQDSGTDCSGLCQWVYNDCGLLDNVGLSGRWTTYTIFAHGTTVSINDAVAGDLILSNFSAPGVPEHVAIITEINLSQNKIRIIEAPDVGLHVREIWIDYNINNYNIRRML